MKESPGRVPAVVTIAGWIVAAALIIILVSAQSGALSANEITGFTLSANPNRLSVNSGGSATTTVSVLRTGDFTAGVTLTCSNGVPSAASCSFSPPLVMEGSGTSMLTVVTSTSTPSGTFVITVQGTSGSTTSTTTITLVVGGGSSDFSLSASPTSVSVDAGSSASIKITVAPNGNFDGTVSLSCRSGLPSGGSCTFSPSSIITSGTSTLTLATGQASPSGSFAIEVLGTSGSASATVAVTLTVSGSQPGYTMAATPNDISLSAGSSTVSTISVTALNAFTGTVALGCAGGLPSGVTCSPSPTSITEAGSSFLTITTTSSTPSGSFIVTVKGTSTITVNGTSTTIQESVPLTLVVTGSNLGFSLSASPAALTLVNGGSGASTITVSPISGFGSKVTFDCSSGLPTGAACAFDPVSLPSGSGTSVLTITTTGRGAGVHLRRQFSYALWLPMAGIVFAGVSVRCRRRLRIAFLGSFLVCGLFLTGCGGSSAEGTSAGTYNVIVTGSATNVHTSGTVITLTVQ
ncbi:MAG: hypothetical protein H0X25_06855 [Acidobacteriales bacterium]|nr:hypothetical protein [Terriglobales bacterium]